MLHLVLGGLVKDISIHCIHFLNISQNKLKYNLILITMYSKVKS